MIPYNAVYGAQPQSISMQSRTPPPMMGQPLPMSMPMSRSPQPMARAGAPIISPPLPISRSTPPMAPMGPPLMQGSPPPFQHAQPMPLAGSMPPIYPTSGSPPPQPSRVVRLSGSSPAQVPRITRVPVNPGPVRSPPPPGDGRQNSSSPLRLMTASSPSPQRSPRPSGNISPRGESDMWRARAHAASARPDPGMAQATAATSRALRMPRSLGDSVALTEETVDPSFHYGPGLRVSNHSPYVVQKANLRGENSNDISEKISLYDVLLEVDGAPTSQVNPEESLVGQAQSMAHLTLQSGTTGQRYDILCKRHLPSPVPQGTKKRYKAHSNLAGQDLRAEAQVIADLEKLRLEVSDGFGMAKDLLAESSSSTLGMHLRAAEHDQGGDASNVVNTVIPGGPAWLSGKVRVGDQVISVDGQSVDGRNLLDMLRGDGSVGSMKVIKFRSPQGAVTEAAICRTPMSDVDRLGAVIESLEKLEERIKAGADKGVLLDLHREVAKHVMENADSQLAKQQALANRLLVTQLAVSDGVNALLARLHPLGPNSPPPAAAPQDNVEQLKRQLDESMANTDALRQRAKHLTEQLKEMEDKLQQQAATDVSKELLEKLRAAEAEAEMLQRNAKQNVDADRIRERAEVYENKWNEESKRAEALKAEVKQLEAALTRTQASKDTVEQQARLLEEKNRGLANRLKEIESSSQAEIEHHRRERQRTEAVVRSAAPPPPPPPPAPGNDDSIREEYEGLLKELTDAGLKDPHDVDRLLTALKGPPVTDANAVVALLGAVRNSGLTNTEACAAIVGAGSPRGVPHAPHVNGDAHEESKLLQQRIADLEKALEAAQTTPAKEGKEKESGENEEMEQLREHDKFMTKLVEKLQEEVRDAQSGLDKAIADRDAAVTQLEHVSDALRKAAHDAELDKQAVEDANREARALQAEIDRMRGKLRMSQEHEYEDLEEKQRLQHEADKLRAHDHKISDVLDDLRHRVRGHKASESMIHNALQKLVQDVISARHEASVIQRDQMEPQYQPDFRDDIVQKMQDEIVGQYEQLKRAHQTIEDLRRASPRVAAPPSRSPPSRTTPSRSMDGPDLNAPFLEPSGGIFSSAPIRVQIISREPNATIYATTSGDEPSPAHHELNGHSPLTVTVSRPGTVKAMVSNGLLASAVITGDYAFNSGPLMTRSQSPADFPVLRAQSPAPLRSPAPAIQRSPAPLRDSSPYVRDPNLNYLGSPRHPRGMSPARPHTVGAAPPDGGPRLAGVGVVLKRDQHMVRVKDIAPGSAAAMDGRIAIRDRLLAIDGRSVEGKSMSTLGDEIRGMEGTYISMVFSRASGRGAGQEYEVSLCRTVPLMVADKSPV